MVPGLVADPLHPRHPLLLLQVLLLRPSLPPTPRSTPSCPTSLTSCPLVLTRCWACQQGMLWRRWQLLLHMQLTMVGGLWLIRKWLICLGVALGSCGISIPQASSIGHKQLLTACSVSCFLVMACEMNMLVRTRSVHHQCSLLCHWCSMVAGPLDGN
jgi:hypothetical protein